MSFNVEMTKMTRESFESLASTAVSPQADKLVDLYKYVYSVKLAGKHLFLRQTVKVNNMNMYR